MKDYQGSLWLVAMQFFLTCWFVHKGFYGGAVLTGTTTFWLLGISYQQEKA